MSIEEITNKLKNKLSEKFINYPYSLVGSSAKNSNFNDIDILMIVDDINIAKKEIMDVFFEFEKLMCDDALKIDGFIDFPLSIAFYDKKNVDRIINSFMSGGNLELTHRIWCLGYWVPESFIQNLRDMKILNDVDNYLEKIKLKIEKECIYSKKTIVKECLDEILIKKQLLDNTSIDSIEYSFYKNDIILCAIRGIKAINGELLVSYKKMDDLVRNINYNDLNHFIETGVNGIENIITTFINYLDPVNDLYYGTWQLSGDFKPFTDKDIEDLIKHAKEVGIHKFDTALVYGKGNVEKILGLYLDDTDIVLSKVPAKTKPPKEHPLKLENYYEYEYIKDCLAKSCSSLNRDYLDICLLHNWTKEWNYEKRLIEYLKRIKEEHLALKVGISLPNDFNSELSEDVLEIIDVIEAPYNSKNTWILSSINKYKEYGIEIILRSLFLQGLEPNRDNYENILEQAHRLGTSIVIGMTSKEQIDKNIKVLKEG